MLRSSKETMLKVPLESGTFQDSAFFTSLSSAARNSVVFCDFKTKVRKYLINRANAHLISWFVYILDYFIYLFIFFFGSNSPDIVHSESFLLILLSLFNINANFYRWRATFQYKYCNKVIIIINIIIIITIIIINCNNSQTKQVFKG